MLRSDDQAAVISGIVNLEMGYWNKYTGGGIADLRLPKKQLFKQVYY